MPRSGFPDTTIGCARRPRRPGHHANVVVAASKGGDTLRLITFSTPVAGEAGRSPALTRNRRSCPSRGTRRAGAPDTTRPEHTLSRNAAGGFLSPSGGACPLLQREGKHVHVHLRTTRRDGARRDRPGDLTGRPRIPGPGRPGRPRRPPAP